MTNAIQRNQTIFYLFFFPLFCAHQAMRSLWGTWTSIAEMGEPPHPVEGVKGRESLKWNMSEFKEKVDGLESAR